MLLKTALLLVALVTAAGGVFLTMYAAADDAPGAVLIGIVVMIGALALGVMTLGRNSPRPT